MGLFKHNTGGGGLRLPCVYVGGAHGKKVGNHCHKESGGRRVTVLSISTKIIQKSMIFQHVGKNKSFVAWSKLVNFVVGDHCKCEQPFCQIITVYTKEQEYENVAGRKRQQLILSQRRCLQTEMERELAPQWTQSELKQLTWQHREVCAFAYVFKEGLSDNRYKDTTEQRENPDTSDQLDVSSYWSCH